MAPSSVVARLCFQTWTLYTRSPCSGIVSDKSLSDPNTVEAVCRCIGILPWLDYRVGEVVQSEPRAVPPPRERG